VLCGRRGERARIDLCRGCEADLPTNDYHCVICAEPLQGEAHAERICGACLQHRPHFEASCIPFRYAYPLDHLIRRLKYGGCIANGRVLGELLAASAGARACLPQMLLPVPLGQRRFRGRGYNQAIVLAQHVSRSLKIPLQTDLLVRTRETLVQAGLDQRERRKNIKRAFALMGTLPCTHIALIDDVVTTGSTANELAGVLKRAGAARVEIWAVARVARSRSAQTNR